MAHVAAVHLKGVGANGSKQRSVAWIRPLQGLLKNQCKELVDVGSCHVDFRKVRCVAREDISGPRGYGRGDSSRCFELVPGGLWLWRNVSTVVAGEGIKGKGRG